MFSAEDRSIVKTYDYINRVVITLLLNGLRGYMDNVVDLRLTVEWGVGMRRQDPSYGEVVQTSFTSSDPSRRK